jgi:hypothetical protein
MGLSDWQLDRLRNALAAYHAYGHGSSGEPFNWKDVAEGILDVAGPELLGLTDDRDTDQRRKRVRQFSERLRQFVEGVTVEGRHKRPRLQDEWLNATLRFALHEDYALLTEDELREHAPEHHAALRLLEYLALATDRERILPPATLEGMYRNGRLEPLEGEKEDFVVREVTLQRASKEGLIQITMTEDSYDPVAVAEFDEWTAQQRHKQRRSQTLYGGWAVLTPEDNLLFFLKCADNGANLYYLTMVSDQWHARQSPVAGLAVLEHDYPIETTDDAPLAPKAMPAIREKIGGKIVLFERTA